jgi:hypothetical protein
VLGSLARRGSGSAAARPRPRTLDCAPGDAVSCGRGAAKSRCVRYRWPCLRGFRSLACVSRRVARDRVRLGGMASAAEWDAFRRCGLLGGCLCSARFQRASAVAAPPVVPTELPTLPQLQTLYPRNEYIPVDALFAPLHREPVERVARLSPAVARPSPSAASAGPSNPEGPWLGRLRSSSRASLESSQPESASPEHPPSRLLTPARARSRLSPVAVSLPLPWPARAAPPQPAVRPRPSE